MYYTVPRFFMSIAILAICSKCHAQADTVKPINKNQVYVELIGNNFIHNSGGSIISVNYARKFSNKIFFAGFANPSSLGYNPDKSRKYAYNFHVGILFRNNYKRNAMWMNISLALSKGAYYTVTSSRRDATGRFITTVLYHDMNFQLFPAACYQLQSREENFVCRFTLGLKMTSALLASEYDDVGGHYLKMFPWLGISIGGGF
jgi:hypothetical protein